MFKIGLKIFSVLAALVIILLSYYYFFDRNEVIPDIFDVFNENGIVIRFNQPDNILTVASSSEVLQETLQNDSSLYYASSLFHGLYQYQSFENAAATYMIDDSVIVPIYIVQSKTVGQSVDAMQWITKTFYSKFKTVEKKKESQKYYTIYRKQNAILYIAECNGIILWSQKIEVLLKASKMVSSYSVKSESDKLASTASMNSFANIFIRADKLSGELGSTIFEQDKSLDKSAQFFALDVHIKNKQIVLSGLSSISSKKESKVIAKATGTKFSMPDVVPEQSEMVYQFEVDNLFDQFQLSNKSDKFKYSWLKGFTSNELVFFKSSSYFALAFKVKGKSIATAALQEYTKQFTSNIKLEKYKFDKSTKFDVIKSDFNWVKALLPSYCDVYKNFNYAVLSGEYVVFTTNFQFIQEICRNTILQQNLKSTYRFKEQSSALSSSSNRLIYLDLDSDGFKSFFTERAFSLISSMKLSDLFQYLVWQSSGSGQYVYNHIVLYKSINQLSKQNVRWKTKLQNNARIKPVMVRNHITGKTEIMVQDENYYLYLINDKGRILWQKLLDGNVLGEIVQVDKYKNGKLQYLLNTANNIYLIDRNGNYVERFPMNLPSEASAGLAVFDYDKNRNYRIFVPLCDKRMLLYDLDANLIPGWKFEKSDAVVTSPAQFVRIKDKDFIFFADSLRHYFLNRQGDNRIKPKQLVGKSVNNPIYFDAKTAQWVSTSSNGDLIYTSIDGSVEVIPLDSMSINHYFLYADVNRDGELDFVFVDNDLLTVYDHSLKKMYNYQFSNSISEPPSYYVFSKHTAGIGIVDKQAGKVFMFNSKGKQFNSYPYPGVTPFTISVINGVIGFNLVVGNFDGFLYTYQQK